MIADVYTHIKEDSIYIYGTGNKARKLATILDEADEPLDLKGFIVSPYVEHQEVMENHPVNVLTSEFAGTIACDSSIFIATSENNAIEIVKYLKSLELSNYIYISNEDLIELNRRLNPIKTSIELDSINPVSRIFGLDRGTPIDRYYIEHFLDTYKPSIEQLNRKAGIRDAIRFFEVGDNTYSKEIAQYYTNVQTELEILDYSAGQDLTDIATLKKDYYDVFVCTQTLNFIYDIKEAILGAYYTIRNGGYLLATMAATITPISRYDMDRWGHYWGVTDLCAKNIFSEVFGEKNVTVITYGNALAATAFIQGIAVEDLESRELLDEVDKDYQVLLGIVAQKR
ncbi:hypothetical protein SAMN02910292_00853 [Lachnospiraceae bacterium XBB2008]|nr:hypothetical protein SAMN02910292_00853 [Lachnospiraceae bacterium XBB2008]